MGDGYYFPKFIEQHKSHLRVRADRRGRKHSLRKSLIFIASEVRRPCHPIRVLRDVQVQKVVYPVSLLSCGCERLVGRIVPNYGDCVVLTTPESIL